jgi:hypothetical protein
VYITQAEEWLTWWTGKDCSCQWAAALRHGRVAIIIESDSEPEEQGPGGKEAPGFGHAMRSAGNFRAKQSLIEMTDRWLPEGRNDRPLVAGGAV